MHSKNCDKAPQNPPGGVPTKPLRIAPTVTTTPTQAGHTPTPSLDGVAAGVSQHNPINSWHTNGIEDEGLYIDTSTTPTTTTHSTNSTKTNNNKTNDETIDSTKDIDDDESSINKNMKAISK